MQRHVLGEKQIIATAATRELWSWRGVQKREEHRGNAQRECFHKVTLAWKMRRTEFHEFLQLVQLTAWSYKCQQACLGYRLKDPALFLERRQTNNPGADDMKTEI